MRGRAAWITVKFRSGLARRASAARVARGRPPPPFQALLTVHRTAANTTSMSEMTGTPREPADAGDDMDFEAALKRLEQIVQTLERGDAPLEKSIELYEQGQRMKDLCARKLEAARVRVEKIRLDAAGNPAGTEPLDPA